VELPVTVADWAATEARFKQHFRPLPDDAPAPMPFHEYVAADATQREGRTPFIFTLSKERTLRRLMVAKEIVTLAEERQQFWSQLRQLAGVEIPMAVHDAVAAELEADLAKRAEALRAEYDAKVAELNATLPAKLAQRLAQGLMRTAGGSAAVAELLASLPPVAVAASAPTVNGTAVNAPAPAVASAPVAPMAAPAAEAVAPVEAAAASTSTATATATATDDEPLAMEAYIDSIRCTSCNECTGINNRMFAYNADKQAYVKDASAGTFQQLVLAAERCPVSIIHPGTPLDPHEKDLAKWAKRAERFA
jgi:pyruvate-ferredoxin/flavodoxin oxidoreductase